jgi:hypothetical protein
MSCPYNLTMRKKNSLSRRLEVRVTEKEFFKLKMRSKIYDGSMSDLVRYWIENADIPQRNKKNELHKTNLIDS